MTHTKINPKARLSIIKRVENGEAQNKIAKEFDISEGYVSKIVNKSNHQRNVIDDPNPAITTATLQKRYWAKYRELKTVKENRADLQNTNIAFIEDQIRICERGAQEATTSKMAEASKRRADTYRLELQAIRDFSEFDSKITDLIQDLYTLSQVLCKIRKAGLGRVG